MLDPLMGYLDQLNQAVQSAIRSGRIGQPVFVRCTASTASSQPARWRALMDLVTAVRQWLGCGIHRIYASESTDGAKTTLAIQFHGGPSALISTVSAGPAGPILDVVVLGNHGAIYYHRASNIADKENPDVEPAHAPDRALRTAIETAIRSGKPQTVQAEDRP